MPSVEALASRKRRLLPGSTSLAVTLTAWMAAWINSSPSSGVVSSVSGSWARYSAVTRPAAATGNSHSNPRTAASAGRNRHVVLLGIAGVTPAVLGILGDPHVGFDRVRVAHDGPPGVGRFVKPRRTSTSNPSGRTAAHLSDSQASGGDGAGRGHLQQHRAPAVGQVRGAVTENGGQALVVVLHGLAQRVASGVRAVRGE